MLQYLEKSESSELRDMIKTIRHRGPDHEGYYGNEFVQLGSCRLSIFDLSDKGNMPMHDRNKDIL